MQNLKGLTKQEIKHYLWRVGDLSWKLHSTQKAIYDITESQNQDEILILSARQLGKSYLGVIIALEYCIKYPGRIVRIMASTLKQVQDIVADNLLPICRDAPEGFVERHKSSYRWTIGGSSLRLGALEKQYVDYSRGGNASLIICEEGGFVKSDEYQYAITSVIGPQLLRSAGRLMHITTPSEDLNHVIHTEIAPRCSLKDAVFSYTIYDNPQISQEQIEKAIELCGGEDTVAWRREYLAEMVRDPSRMIVPSFSRDSHVARVILPDYGKWIVATDFGGVRDKTVSLLMGYDFLENQILVIDERVHEKNTDTTEIVDAIRQMERQIEETHGNDVVARWADAPGQLQIDLQKLHGLEMRLPRKDDWKAAINNVQVEFGNKNVTITPNCTFLIHSLESGRYNDNRTDFDRNETLGHCDALAALMYGVRMLDRSKPFIDLVPTPDKVFVKPNPKPEHDLAQAIHPKVFSASMNREQSVKRFGTFKQ